MTKLIDQPGVSELVSKEVAKAVKATKAEAVRVIKAKVAEHVEFHSTAGAKDMASSAKRIGADVVAAVKA